MDSPVRTGCRVGWIAAISAARTYALEAEPVIVVRQRTLAEAFSATGDEKRRVDAAPLYVVAPNPTLAEGITLRPYEMTDDPNYGRSGRIATPMPKPVLVFAFHNVGRSVLLQSLSLIGDGSVGTF